MRVAPHITETSCAPSGVLARWVLGAALSWRQLIAGALVTVGAAGMIMGRDDVRCAGQRVDRWA